MLQKKESFQSSGMKVRNVQKAIFSLSLMTTLSAIQDGSSQLFRLLIPTQILEEFQVLVLSLNNFDGTGTFSVSSQQSIYTISFFVKEDQVFLDISVNRERGQQERLKILAPMKEPSISLKPVICLLVLNSFILLAVLMKVIKG